MAPAWHHRKFGTGRELRAHAAFAPVAPGKSAPLGASVWDDGVNFSVFSKNATQIDLLLFPDEQSGEPFRVIALDPDRHRTYHYWHAFVPGLGPGQVYAYRAHGPMAPELGLRFDSSKVLLDPYGLAVAVPVAYDRHAATRAGDNAATAMKSVVAEPSAYDYPLGSSRRTAPRRKPQRAALCGVPRQPLPAPACRRLQPNRIPALDLRLNALSDCQIRDVDAINTAHRSFRLGWRCFA